MKKTAYLLLLVILCLLLVGCYADNNLNLGDGTKQPLAAVAIPTATAAMEEPSEYGGYMLLLEPTTSQLTPPVLPSPTPYYLATVALPPNAPPVFHGHATPLATAVASTALLPSPVSTRPFAFDFELTAHQGKPQTMRPGDRGEWPKIGFHVGAEGNEIGLGKWMRDLDAMGIPFVIKSANNAGPLLEAQVLAKASGVPHILIFRRCCGLYELPDYSLDPIQAANEHWARHRASFPPELDPSMVWIEIMNEVDRTQSEWLGQFAVQISRLVLRDGYKWAAFGWATGEPEPSHWQSPSMQEFLRIAAAHPAQIAISLHEYSLSRDSINGTEFIYPNMIGRFQQLYYICDAMEIARPTVFITEWGWEYQDVPSPEVAMQHIDWAARLYARYPEVRGVAIWYLGGGFGGIAAQTQRLIDPLASYITSTYFTMPDVQARIDPDIFENWGEN